MHNRTESGNRFVQFDLEGRQCNRDAIGARVELYSGGDAQSPMIATVRAGEGYLAQSSKRLHFGLGKMGEPLRVVVRWPGGDVEEFRDLQANRRYRIRQSEGIEQVDLPPPEARPRLSPSTIVAPPVSDAARVVLVNPIPLPNLSYLRLGGDEAQINDRDGHPQLISLWASWCPSCLRELDDVTQNAEKLRAGGLRVAALSVDQPADYRAARAMLKKLQWSFDAGFVAEEVVGVLDTLQRAVLERSRPLPLPSSFLLDQDDRIVVIYKGPVDVGTVLADVERLTGSLEERRAAAVPYPGRWLAPPPRTSLSQRARELALHGYPSVRFPSDAESGDAEPFPGLYSSDPPE
jgi:thiol-disulfide isomerase/thioredoxin